MYFSYVVVVLLRFIRKIIVHGQITVANSNVKFDG